MDASKGSVTLTVADTLFGQSCNVTQAGAGTIGPVRRPPASRPGPVS
jgi:hypothetical protein